MPLGPYQGIARACLAGRVTPRFRHRLTAFDASAAVRLRSPSSISPAGLQSEPWLQRSPPRLLTAVACSGLGSAPDPRARRALLHLSSSCASRCGPVMLVTHDPFTDEPPVHADSPRRLLAGLAALDHLDGDAPSLGLRRRIAFAAIECCWHTNRLQWFVKDATYFMSWLVIAEYSRLPIILVRPRRPLHIFARGQRFLGSCRGFPRRSARCDGWRRVNHGRRTGGRCQ